MILSREQIEDIAGAVTKDFNEFFFQTEEQETRFVRATPIEQFAHDYLGLEVSFANLSADGNICGLTAYADTEYLIEEGGELRAIPLKRNQVLLDRQFLQSDDVRHLRGKRRFTLAHECAHQILFQMESTEKQVSCRRAYSERRSYSLRDLKSREDWNEWQANALGASLLMPQSEIDLAMWYFAQSRRLISYEGRFTYRDQNVVSMLCETMGVSKSAAVIRLRRLGYIEDRPYDPYRIYA